MNIGFQPAASNQRSDEAIENDGWFPTLSLSYFANQYGIPAEMNNDIVKSAVLICASQVNLALADYKEKALAAGYRSMVEVPGDSVGGKAVNQLHYLQAVYSKAKAQLHRDQITIDRKPNMDSQANHVVDIADYYERQASAAISNVLGERFIGVALI